MNFLWIEDNEKISELKKVFFEDAPSFNRNRHKLIIPKSFDEALEEIENANLKYDFIILDINLENFEIGIKGKMIQEEFSKHINEHEFMKEAGFHFYLKLIPQGFKRERIIFLTGNTENKPILSLLWKFEQAYKSQDERVLKETFDEARRRLNDEDYNKLTNLINNSNFNEIKVFLKNLADEIEEIDKTNNTYDIVCKRFQEARIHLPYSIQKDNIKDFHIWIKGKVQADETNSYIFLRRAIIESCKSLMEIVENHNLDELLIYNKTLYQEFSNLSKDYIILYLTKLKNYLPLNPPKNKQQLFYSFTRELSDLWEKSKGYLNRKNVKFDCEIEFNFKNFCQNQMKLLRNWTAHNQLSNKLSEKEIAFYFITAMRALFNLDVGKIYSYEKLIFSIFDRKLFEKENIVNNLADSYFNIRNLSVFKYSNPKGNSFNEIIISLGNSLKNVKDMETINKIAIQLFYQNYFHSLNPAMLKLNEVNIEKLQDKVLMYIDFSVFPDLKKYEFLEKLARSIYSEAFNE